MSVSTPTQRYITRLTRTPVTVVYNGVKGSAVGNGPTRTVPPVPGRKVLLYAGKPIVAGIVREGAEIAQRSGGNFVYAPEDPQGLSKALETLFLNLDDLKMRALGNSAIVRESFTREKAAAALEGVLRKLL